MNQTLSLQANTPIEQRVNAARFERDLWHHRHDSYFAPPVAELDAVMSRRAGDAYEALVDAEDAVATVNISDGRAYLNAYGVTPQDADALLARLRREVPAAEQNEPDMIDITFWTLGRHGPEARRPRIDAPSFAEIEDNYPAAGDVHGLLNDWHAGEGGQLLLWHGEAGTGKTTALRALGREWRDWADLHYIVDPDRFFSESGAYMMQVMLDDGTLAARAEESAMRWRILILEDCGELLQPDARRDVGQALSRLLNACDGLIGRGLRLLLLITTNEPLEKVHPAIARPGRCARHIEFERFTAAQATAWLVDHGVDSAGVASRGQLTLADLYALAGQRRPAAPRQPVGFAG